MNAQTSVASGYRQKGSVTCAYRRCKHDSLGVGWYGSPAG
jgi:hypothetical protein